LRLFFVCKKPFLSRPDCRVDRPRLLPQNNISIRSHISPADVSGRVSTSSGRGISGAMVSIFNTSTGDSFTRMTNTFGYYQFNDLPVSDFYVMTVSHKRYLFLEPSRSFTLEEDMFDVDFIASDDF
jgi:hypothetical protein